MFSILLLIVIYIGFIALGLPDSLLSSSWPAIHDFLNADSSSLGIISMTISSMTIISSLFSYKLNKKIGIKFVTSFSILLTAVATFGFAFSNKFWMFLVFAVPYGLGAGAIDSALNNFVALHYTSKHMSWLHCFWGVGTVVSPLVASFAIKYSTWRNGFVYIGILLLLIFIIYLFAFPLWGKFNDKNEESKKTKNVGIFDAIKIKGVIFILIGFLAYCAGESTSMNWASTYVVEVKNFSADVGARCGSLFFIGITAGRFIAGFFTEKLGDKKMIILGSSIILFGLILFLLPFKSAIFTLIAFVIIGFGCAPIYPSIIHATPFNFGKENSPAIIGIEMAFAYIGSTFMSPLFGLLGKLISFEILPFYILFFFLLMFVMVLLGFKNAKTKN